MGVLLGFLCWNKNLGHGYWVRNEKKDVSHTFIGEIFRLVSVLIDKIPQSMKTWNINEYRMTQHDP